MDDIEKQRVRNETKGDVKSALDTVEGLYNVITKTARAIDPAILGAHIKAADVISESGLPYFWAQVVNALMSAALLKVGKKATLEYISTLLDILEAGEGILKNG